MIVSMDEGRMDVRVAMLGAAYSFAVVVASAGACLVILFALEFSLKGW